MIEHRIILYQQNVKNHAMLMNILESDPSLYIQHLSPLSLIEQLSVEQYSGILYECDMVSQKNIQDLKLLAKAGIPYYIIAGQVEEGVLSSEELKNHYIHKPQKASEVFRNQILLKVRLMRYVKPLNKSSTKKDVSSNGIIGIAASTGGPHALSVILKALSEEICGVVVVQHMIEEGVQNFANYLNGLCKVSVRVAQEGDLIKAGVVYIAKQKQHIGIVKEYDGYHLHYQQGPKINCVCPSADMLFESMAKYASPAMLGIILTGMGNDGAKGLKALKDAGGYTIIQNETSSEIYGMPKEAKRLNAYHKELALEEISAYLTMYYLNQMIEKGNL